MPTLAQLIAIHEAAQPAPIALTPLGTARVAVRRFARTVAVLDPQGRQEALMLAMSEIVRLLNDVSATTT